MLIWIGPNACVEQLLLKLRHYWNCNANIRGIDKCIQFYLFVLFYYGLEGGHIIGSVSVRPSKHETFDVRFSPKWHSRCLFTSCQSTKGLQHSLRFDLEYSITSIKVVKCFDRLLEYLWNGLADVYLPDTNQLRQQCRCATCSSFWSWTHHDCDTLKCENDSICEKVTKCEKYQR